MQQLTLTRPDDWHLHLRDGALLSQVVCHSARHFARALIMPNLKPAVTTVALAQAYYQRIITALPKNFAKNLVFQPLLTLYLTEHTRVEEIQHAAAMPWLVGVKFYPANATTNTQSGVTDISCCRAVLETMQALGMPLLMHGEMTDSAVDIFDREAVFIERVLMPLRRDFPQLKMVLEHISTQTAVNYIASENQNARTVTLAATITAHHLLYQRNHLLVGGVHPHYYCLPVLKREADRQALLKAATSGQPYFFLGTDSAPHLQRAKENACGCAGCYTAYHALSLYAQAFDSMQALPQLEGFASFFGADFYGVPRNQTQITLIKKSWEIPGKISIGYDQLIPLAAGEVLEWQVKDD